jgi:glycosyltransferase involved in cell wall biosynthesis
MVENSFVVVIPSYQNKAWCEKTLFSVLSQKYSNFRAIYSDDCSTDGTADEAERILKEYDTENKITLIRNTERLYAVHNIYNMVHSCKDDEIIVVVDGDDWLENQNVLSRLNEEYNKDVWMTYGQYISYHDQEIGCSCEIPKEVIYSGMFRRYQWCSSHLRTHYAWLYKQIRQEDLMHNGQWLQISGDLAAMFPMLEMAGPKQSFIPDILYVYNYTSPLNDGKINRGLQIEMERKIRAMNPYKRIINR